MEPIAVYLLRQSTRPSEEEAIKYVLILYSILMASGVKFEIPDKSTPHYIANLGNERQNVKDEVDNFIISCGGKRFLDDNEQFEFKYFYDETGNPPEPTAFAIVFSKDEQTKSDDIEVYEFIVRGMRWEELGRLGDALHCYNSALKLFPNNHVLHFKLGIIQLKFPLLLSRAYRHLKKACDACPERAEYIHKLGECYLSMADTQHVEVRGVEREELLRMALSMFERAAALAPENQEVFNQLQSLRNKMGLSGSRGFFE